MGKMCGNAKTRRQAGFTLVELLVVIAIIGI
ncbi:MAG: type II secretion system protein, partial [Thermoguttaceae bacterium]|nr:type II secretion system protein [Thermoguttaceae bacterium]